MDPSLEVNSESFLESVFLLRGGQSIPRAPRGSPAIGWEASTPVQSQPLLCQKGLLLGL